MTALGPRASRCLGIDHIRDVSDRAPDARVQPGRFVSKVRPRRCRRNIATLRSSDIRLERRDTRVVKQIPCWQHNLLASEALCFSAMGMAAALYEVSIEAGPGFRRPCGKGS
jgi:hypothetical protein